MGFTLVSTQSVEDLQKWAGSKAASLARASRAGAVVPEWFCLTAEAFDAFLRESHLQEDSLVRGSNFALAHKEIEALFDSRRIPKLVEEELGGQLIRLQLMNQYVSVRTSPLESIGLENSLAGSGTTFLFQKGGAQIHEAIKRCWASIYSEAALVYRKERGLGLRDVRYGIIVQRMVMSDCSGVALSRNPEASLDRKRVLVRAGFGAAANNLHVDSYAFDRETQQISTQVGDKATGLKLNAHGDIERSEIPDHMRKELLLTKPQVQDIAKLVLQLEEKIGVPQECEWAIVDGKLYCLQSRSINSLPNDSFYQQTVRGELPAIWDNSILPKDWTGITLPLSFTFLRSVLERAGHELGRVQGISDPSRLGSLLDRVFGLARGRLYLNWLSWHEWTLQLPDGELSKSSKAKIEEFKGKLSADVQKVVTASLAAAPNRTSGGLIARLNRWQLLRRCNARMQNLESTWKTLLDQLYKETRKANAPSSLSDLATWYRRLWTQFELDLAAIVATEYGSARRATGSTYRLPLPKMEVDEKADGGKAGASAGDDLRKVRAITAQFFDGAYHLFQGMGIQLVKLGALRDEADILYLNVDEVLGYIEGQATCIDLTLLATARKREFGEYHHKLAPTTFVTFGAAGTSFFYQQVLNESAVSGTKTIQMPVASNPQARVAARPAPSRPRERAPMDRDRDRGDRGGAGGGRDRRPSSRPRGGRSTQGRGRPQRPRPRA